ncbi:MAG: GNAT family N-acetyltransferase, partial [Bacteroidales bacterium]
MIRKFHPDDLDSIMEIWLTSNKETHNYIPESYWDSNYQTVKGLIPHADIYVYILHNQIVGFIGLIDDYIAGLFVR